MNFTFDQARDYFVYRLPDEKIGTRNQAVVRCPFHADRTPSLSLSLEKGAWKCFAGCGEGGILDFERKMFPGFDADETWKNISRICGIDYKRNGKPLGKLIATYSYFDAAGHLLFEKQRYEPKDFRARAPKGNGWTYVIPDEAKTLYRLPELIRASVVMVCEGEKDADALAALDWASLAIRNGTIPVVACTTAPNGAESWSDRFAPYFAGKKVFIVPDSDEAGAGYAAAVAQSVSRYAYSVHIAEVTGAKDASEYLAHHTPVEFVALLKKSKPYQPEKTKEKPWLVSPLEMVSSGAKLDWLVEGMIHCRSRGLVVAHPKAGKSMLALDLAVALAGQQSWIGYPALSRRVRCAVISREDPSFMTRDRLREFARARGLTMDSLASHLRFNTKDQARTFLLQKDEDCDLAIRWLKQESIEFAIFDVLNVLHSANENSNTEMTEVMNRLARIRDEADCALAVIHHTPHSDPKRARGAGAIESWWEWRVSIVPSAENQEVKEISLINKVGKPRKPLDVIFVNGPDGTMIAPVSYG